MSINREFYPLLEPEETLEAEIIITDVPAFSSPLETEREWLEPIAPVPPEIIYQEALAPEPVEPEIRTEFIERIVEVPVPIVKELGFFAVLLAILCGLPIDGEQTEMV